MIQILVENALKHAFKGRKSDNAVIIEIAEDDDYIVISVSDNGIGIREDILDDLGMEIIDSTEGTGSAVENLNKRLISLFGTESKLDIQSNVNGTRLKSRIPKRRSSE